MRRILISIIPIVTVLCSCAAFETEEPIRELFPAFASYADIYPQSSDTLIAGSTILVQRLLRRREDVLNWLKNQPNDRHTNMLRYHMSLFEVLYDPISKTYFDLKTLLIVVKDVPISTDTLKMYLTLPTTPANIVTVKDIQRISYIWYYEEQLYNNKPVRKWEVPGVFFTIKYN
jgi:hypothetical protein